MITEINANPNNWKKKCYIANKLTPNIPKYDDENNEICKYDTPIKYEFNYQPISSYTEIMEFGERTKITQKAVIPIKYKGMFKESDVAYLEGVEPTGEVNNGDKANYKLLPPRNGNSVIIIYFEKLTGK